MNIFDPLNQNYRKVYVGNIRHGTTVEELTTFLEELTRKVMADRGRAVSAPKVVDEVAITDQPDRNVGFAMVTLSSVVMATELLLSCPEVLMGARKLRLKRPSYIIKTEYPLGCDVAHIPPIDSGPGTMFMAGIPSDAREEQVLMVLGRFGRVEAFKLVRHEWGDSRGFAFFRYEDPAHNAVAEKALHGWRLSEARSLTVHPSDQEQRKQATEKRAVCFLYRKGQCRANCPNVHEGDVRLPTRLCPKAAAGGEGCPDNLRCPFAHSTTEIPCRYFASGRCNQEDACQYSHVIPCYDLVLLDSCPRGAKCLFWHDVLPGLRSAIVKEHHRWQGSRTTRDPLLSAFLEAHPDHGGPTESARATPTPIAPPTAAAVKDEHAAPPPLPIPNPTPTAPPAPLTPAPAAKLECKPEGFPLPHRVKAEPLNDPPAPGALPAGPALGCATAPPPPLPPLPPQPAEEVDLDLGWGDAL
jgi:hypothetical protein